MKTRTIMTALAVLPVIIGSCDKEYPALEQEAGQEQYKLEISIPDVVTKVTNVGNEASASSIRVYVYRSDGILEASGAAMSDKVTVSMTSGSKTVAVLVNAPAPPSVSSLSNLKSSVSALSDNAVSAFVMYGDKSIDVKSDMSVTVDVHRLVAKVEIDKITNALALEQYANTSIVLKGVYLINVSGECPYAVESAPTMWLNKKAHVATDCPALLYDSVSNSVAHGSSNSTIHSFYCYPNNTANDSSSATWSARYTRLVVEVSIDGKTWYYPISIPSIKSNHVYRITELKITRIGSTDPDTPVSIKNADFEINVLPWEEGTSSVETI